MLNIKSIFVIRPSNILSAGMYVCTFQTGHFTVCSSEGVKKKKKNTDIIKGPTLRLKGVLQQNATTAAMTNKMSCSTDSSPNYSSYCIIYSLFRDIRHWTVIECLNAKLTQH